MSAAATASAAAIGDRALPARGQRRAGARRRLSRLPLRTRLVAGFVVAITVVLSAAGTFVYWRVSYALDLRLQRDLSDAATALTPLVTPDGALRSDPNVTRTPLGRQYQVLDAAGRVLAAGPQLGAAPLLAAGQARAALRGPIQRDVGALLPVSARPLRLLAVPLGSGGPARILVVAVRRDQRDEALRELLAQLTVAGLGALVVSAVVGERLAKAALAPVERYRTQAASIAAGASGVRLDVPVERDDEVTRLGQTLNEMLAALERTLQRERRFTQDASHELRTPLTLLSTRVQVALRRPRSTTEHETTLRELSDDIDALSALAEQLLQLSSYEGQRPDSAGSDLVEVTRDVAARYHDDAPAPGSAGTVTAVPGTGCVDVIGEMYVAMPAAEVRQLLSNLLGNAELHGGPPITVQLRRAEGAAVLTITDSGPGVPPAFLPDATERFARAPISRDRPGAGLGLSLVQALADRRGAELRLCSAGHHHRYSARVDVACEHPRTGTTATILLPLLAHTHGADSRT